MSRPSPAEPRRVYFTVESANRALPLVRAIVRDVLSQWAAVSDLERRLAPLSDRRCSSGAHELYGEELACQRAELAAEIACKR